MKATVRKLLAIALILFSGLVPFHSLYADGAETGLSIAKIDDKKKIITIGEAQFRFDDTTIVYDVFGKKVDFSVLKPGMVADVYVDVSKRYVGSPTAKRINLRSVIED